MKVRFRFRQGRPVQRRRGKNRRVAAAIGALLVPIALMAWVLGLWKLGSDLGVAAEFGITGLFSHWQIWIGLALGLSAAASALNRYGQGGELEDSRVETAFPINQPPAKTSRAAALPEENKRAFGKRAGSR